MFRYAVAIIVSNLVFAIAPRVVPVCDGRLDVRAVGDAWENKCLAPQHDNLYEETIISTRKR